jgi:hypothetical protein
MSVIKDRRPFQARPSNPEPPGEIITTGRLSGEYLFQHADLGVFRGIDGLLSSAGKFSGTLSRIESGRDRYPELQSHIKLSSSAIANSVLCGSERRKWGYASAASSGDFLENEGMVGRQRSGRIRATRKDHLSRINDDEWANSGPSAALCTIRAVVKSLHLSIGGSLKGPHAVSFVG